MRFSRIRLENWRNFAQVDVPLQTRAFLVGANASGKSNFLDVFRFLRILVVPGGGFQEAVASRGGVSSIRYLVARHPNTDVLIEVDLEDDDETIWRYRLVFNQDRHSHRLVLREEKIWHEDEMLLDRPDADDKVDSARLSQTYLEQTFANRDFREIVDFFQSVTYWHIVPQLIRDPERSYGQQADPYGGDFLEQIAAVNQRSQKARLRRIQQALTKAIPQLSNLEVKRDRRGIAHLRAKYDHWRPSGAWQNETEFSDGTLRLIGLLWALQDRQGQDRPGPLLFEEPELSLHPGVVRQIPQMMQSIQREQKVALRQIFISTHSSDLLSDEGIALDEILLFLPTKEGTDVQLGISKHEIVMELEAGLTIPEIVLPRTEPLEISQQPLFSD